MKLNGFVLIAILVSALSTHAQDKIYKRDGDVIDAKVKSVGTSTITFKRYDNTDGPEYSILKRDVTQIKYENGSTDNFENEVSRGRHSSRRDYKHGKFVKIYGDNIISIIPAAYTASLDGTINDAGLGINYERQLDERGHISFNLPVMLGFTSPKDFTNGFYNYYNYNGNPGITSYGNYYSLCLMPGIKFYPATSREKVRYSLGASAFAMFGKEPYAVYDNDNKYYNQTGTYPTGDWRYTMYGFMLSNSVNIMASKHLMLAVDLNFGIPVSDNRREDTDGGLNVVLGPMLQFALKVGYRF